MSRQNKKAVNEVSDFVILKRLFTLYARHNKSTIVSCILMAFVDGTRPYVPIVMSGVLIDGLASGAGFTLMLQYLLLGLGVTFALHLLSAYLREYFNARVENCMERQNRDMNEQSMEIDFEHLENPKIQEKKRKQEQVVNVRGGIYWMIIWPLDRGLTGLISVITAAFVAVPLFLGDIEAKGYGFIGSNWLTVLMFAILAVCIYASYKSNRMNNISIRQSFEEYSKCNRVSNYFLHNILFGSETAKDLRIFKQEGLIEEGVCGGESQSRKSLKKIRSLSMQQNCLERTLSNVCGGSIYIYAVLKAYMGLISIGSIVRYASSIIKCVDGFVEVLFALSHWREAADYGRDYLDYVEFDSGMEEKRSMEEGYSREETHSVKEKHSVEKGTLSVEISKDNRFLIEFDHVSFQYPGSDQYVIKDLNLKLDIGERMAIVGRNGSGKTTFIKLLCRLYDVTEGMIKLNGVDIRKYDYEEYLKLFSVVFQDYRMFSLKVGENIAASEEVDQKRAMESLTKAGLGERISRMPDGLETYIGKEFDENGVNVSGGERQKMAIARAIYKNAPFVIMDEPTAALDPVSECDVYAGFDKMVGQKTAIYISHRLASCRFCNDILVFDGGNVLQRGNHDMLVQETGLYQKLWNAQAQYYQ